MDIAANASPRRLALSDEDFRAIKADLAGSRPYDLGEYEVPILKVYRTWVERQLAEYAPPPEKAKYRSLLEAVAGLTDRATLVQDHWEAYRVATGRLSEYTEDLARLRDEIAALASAKDRRARDPDFQAAQRKVDDAAAEVERQSRQLDGEIQLLAADASLSTPERQQIARDGLAAMSVVLRMDLEALALAPIVVIQAVRSIPEAPRDLTFKPNGKVALQAWRAPMYLAGVQEHLERHRATLEVMTAALARALRTSVADSPGFALSESVVDQIVGITLDSFRVDLRAGADSLFYASIGTPARQSLNDGKTTFDYNGRQTKLIYSVDPIVLASARLDVALDWIRMPGVATLGLGYSTDRVYRSGGSLESTSLARSLGVSGSASDVIDAGLGFLGVQSSLRLATFTAGEVRQVIARDVSQTLATAPLRLVQKQADVGYDLLWVLRDERLKAFVEQLVVGGRYLDYSLPRVVYELKDTSRTAGVQRFEFTDSDTGAIVGRESPAQQVRSQYWMLGATARLGTGEAPRWSPFLDLGAYGGIGPTEFYFLKDAARPDTPDNRDVVREPAFVVDGHAGLGLRWRLLPRGSRARLDLRALWQADVLWSTIHRTASSDGAARSTDFGTLDVFHGPAVSLRGSL